MATRIRDLPIHKMTEEERVSNLEYVRGIKRKPEDYDNHLFVANYSVNFWYLEDRCFDTYQSFLEEDTPKTRSDMFKALFELAFGVLLVAKYVPANTDKKVAAYNYAIDYFERLVTNRFSFRAKNGGSRFPFQQYTRLSIRKYIFKCKPTEINSSEFENEISDIIDSLVYNKEGIDKIESDIIKADINREVIRELKIIYEDSELKRLAFLYRDFKENDTSHIYIKEKFPDLYDFLNIVFVLSRKRKSFYSDKLLKGVSVKDLKEHTKVAIRSSLFLMSIANTDLLPKELFLNLDIDSLFRLAETYGGSTITVPTKKELDYLILSVCSAADKLQNNELKLDDVINRNKEEYGISFCRVSTVRDLVNKLMRIPITENENPSSEPLVNTIVTSVANIEKLFDIYTESIRKSSIPPETQISNMVKINTMISSTLNSLLSIKKDIERKISDSEFGD